MTPPPEIRIVRHKATGEEFAAIMGADGKYHRIEDKLVEDAPAPKVPQAAPAETPAAEPPPAEQPKPSQPAADPWAARRAELEQRLATPVKPPRRPYSEGESFAFGGLDGLSLGWAADAMGTGAQAAGREGEVLAGALKGAATSVPGGGIPGALIGAVKGALAGDSGPPRTQGRGMGAPLDERTTQQRVGDEYRDERDLAQSDNPWWFLGGDILGGGIATAPLMAAKPLQAANAAAPLLAGAAEGYGVGYLQGAGKARSGQAAEGGKEGGAQGAVVGGVLGELGGLVAPYLRTVGQKIGEFSDAMLGRSSGRSQADLARAMSEGTVPAQLDEVAPGDVPIAPGTQMKGLTPHEANAELGRAMREQEIGAGGGGLFHGSHDDIIRDSRAAQAVSAREMDAVAGELERMMPAPKELNLGPYGDETGFMSPGDAQTRQRIDDALQFDDAPMSQEPITTPAPNERRLAPDASDRPMDLQETRDAYLAQNHAIDELGSQHPEAGRKVPRRQERPAKVRPAPPRSPQKSPPPLPSKGKPATTQDLVAEAQRGLPDEQLDYLRDGMRPESAAHHRQQIADKVRPEPVDLQVNVREDGSRQWHVIDGRHRLEAARAEGLGEVQARIRVRREGPGGKVVDEDLEAVTIPVPRKQAEEMTQFQSRGGGPGKMSDGMTRHVFEIEDAVFSSKPSPKVRVDLSGLSGMLREESIRLAKMPIRDASEQSTKLAEDFATIAENPFTDFRTALEMRRFLDERAYDAAGQKAGAAAKQYRAMASKMREAIDESLDQAPPELASRMRRALRTYEVASDTARYARGRSATTGAAPGPGDGRGLTRQAVEGVLGNAPSRALSGAANLGRYTLEQFPGMLPAFGAATFDEDLEKTKQSLNR